MIASLITLVNTLLLPLENVIKKYRTPLGWFFYGLSFLSLGAIFSPDTVKFTGEQALNILWFLLFFPIFARVFGLSLARTLMPLRKEIGILMGTLAFVHGAAYIFSYPAQVFDTYFWYTDGMLSYTGVGMVALILTLPLLFSSNEWAIKKLGKNWKRLHRLVYGVLIFTIAHVVLLKWYREFEL